MGGAHHLVTGSAGFIGFHLSAELLRRGHAVTGVDRYSDHYDAAVKRRHTQALEASPRFTFLAVDLCADDWQRLLGDDVTTCFHLAAQPGVRSSWGPGFRAYAEDNILATHNVSELCKSRGMKLVFASSSSVYGEATGDPAAETSPCRPLSPYAVSKLTCEQLISAHAARSTLDATILRYFTVFGPEQRPDMAFHRMCLAACTNRPFPLLGDGAQIRDFTYVDDVVEATIRAADAPAGTTFNIAGGNAVSLADAVRALEDIAGTSIHRETRRAAEGDVRRAVADTQRARTHLGWAPRVSLEQGLERQLAAVRRACESPAHPRLVAHAERISA
jgi:nucleoside-diphosphate-sugar epimerase